MSAFVTRVDGRQAAQGGRDPSHPMPSSLVRGQLPVRALLSIWRAVVCRQKTAKSSCGRRASTCFATRWLGDVDQHIIKTVARGGYVIAASFSAGTLPTATETAPRLSIVVLPFANLIGNPGEDYFADGVTDNLTSDPFADFGLLRDRAQHRFRLQV
jgi:hypothetical protein